MDDCGPDELLTAASEQAPCHCLQWRG